MVTTKQKNKNILFVAHGNNDLDHYLPILHRLNERDKYSLSIIYVNFREEVLTNVIHKYIIDELKVNQVSFTDLYKHKILTNALRGFQRYCKRRYGDNTGRDIISRHRYDLFISKVCYRILEYIVNYLKPFFIPVTKIHNFLRTHSFSMMVIDIMQPTQASVKSSLLSYASYNLMRGCKSLKIPIFMISHGATIRYDNSLPERNDKSIIAPDTLCLCNEKEINIFNALKGKETNVQILGDTRYDYQWIQKLEATALKTNSIKKSKNKFVILNIDANLTFVKHDSINTELNADIVKLLDDFEDVELWFKAHPRYAGATKQIKNDRVKVFRNDVDTNLLLPLADVIISPLSGILFQPIINGKRVIYYNKWQKYCPDGTWTVFDKTPCVYKASNYEELKEGVLAIRRNPNLENKDIDDFYESIVSGGATRNESLIEKYIETIDHILP